MNKINIKNLFFSLTLSLSIFLNFSQAAHAMELSPVVQEYAQNAEEIKGYIESQKGSYKFDLYIYYGLKVVGFGAVLAATFPGVSWFYQSGLPAIIPTYLATWDYLFDCPSGKPDQNIYEVSVCSPFAKGTVLSIPYLYFQYCIFPKIGTYLLNKFTNFGMDNVRMVRAWRKDQLDQRFQTQLKRIGELALTLSNNQSELLKLSLEDRKSLFKAASLAGHLSLMHAILDSEDEVEKKILESLPIVDDICAICLEKWDRCENNDGSLMKAECGHVYHAICIDSWQAIQKDSCPQCRRTPMNLKDLSDVWPDDNQ